MPPDGFFVMIKKLTALQHRVTDTIGIMSLCLVVLLTVLSVGGRYLFRTPIPDVYDLTRLLHGVAISFGLVLATRRRGHIQVDLLYGLLAPGMRHLLALLGDVVVAAVIALLSWQFWGNVSALMSTGETTVMLQWPLWPFAAFIGAGLTLTFLEALGNCLRDVFSRAPEEHMSPDGVPE